MSPENGRVPATPGRDLRDAYDGAADGSERTTDPRRDRGAVVVLVDANHTAVEIIEKRGDRYALELGEALLAPLRRVRTTGDRKSVV